MEHGTVRYALKVIRSSDIGWFRCHFDPAVSKQKAFNIDKVPFKSMFPGYASAGDEFVVPLSIVGPENKAPHILERKLLLQEKNLRLNGAFIYDPESDPNRYRILQVGDFALLGFDGDIYPTAVEMVLIARQAPADAAVWNYLNDHFGQHFATRGGFIQLQRADILSISQTLGLGIATGIGRLLESAEIEAAAAGDADAIRRLAMRGAALSPEQFRQAQEEAQRTGRRGENFVRLYLEDLKQKGAIVEYFWQSEIQPFAPFDFTVTADQRLRKLDAKSTKRGFDERIYISMAELVEMAEGGNPYDLYRVYDMSVSQASLRIALNVQHWAVDVLAYYRGTPVGTQAETIIVDPRTLDFGEEIRIMNPVADED